MTAKELNGRQARWAERLSAFDFIIEHCPGVKNPADAPSRRPDYESDRSRHNMLPTLQEKLRRGLLHAQEPTCSELRRTLQELKAHAKWKNTFLQSTPKPMDPMRTHPWMRVSLLALREDRYSWCQGCRRSCSN